jgi:hypothetical protein
VLHVNDCSAVFFVFFFNNLFLPILCVAEFWLFGRAKGMRCFAYAGAMKSIETNVCVLYCSSSK